MLSRSIIQAGPLSCRLPLADFGTVADMENRGRRLLSTPTAPAVFYTRATLVTIGLLPTDTSLGGLVASPTPPTGDPRTLPRRLRVAVVTDPRMATPEGRALYAAGYGANDLAEKGVLLYGAGIGMVNATNPLASVTAVQTLTPTDRTLNGSSTAQDPVYADWDVSKVDGGEVYVGFTAGSPYNFGVQGFASPGFNLSCGYVTEWAQFKPGADPFDAISISGYTDYGHVDFASPGGHTRRQFFLATDKAAADLPLALRAAARCEKFRYTFWTPDADPAADPIAGDPDGVCAALGIDSVATRKTRDPDTATYIGAICADIADFFS